LFFLLFLIILKGGTLVGTGFNYNEVTLWEGEKKNKKLVETKKQEQVTVSAVIYGAL